jgi:hypothetical protein
MSVDLYYVMRDQALAAGDAAGAERANRGAAMCNWAPEEWPRDPGPNATLADMGWEGPVYLGYAPDRDMFRWMVRKGNFWRIIFAAHSDVYARSRSYVEAMAELSLLSEARKWEAL